MTTNDSIGKPIAIYNEAFFLSLLSTFKVAFVSGIYPLVSGDLTDDDFQLFKPSNQPAADLNQFQNSPSTRDLSEYQSPIQDQPELNNTTGDPRTPRTSQQRPNMETLVVLHRNQSTTNNCTTPLRTIQCSDERDVQKF